MIMIDLLLMYFLLFAVYTIRVLVLESRAVEEIEESEIPIEQTCPNCGRGEENGEREDPSSSGV